jgi:hypothetical protein
MLGDASVHILSESLKYLSNLQVLLLGYNKLTDKSCPSLATSLDSLPNLKHFSLHWNCLTAEGASSIIAAAKENYQIKVLDLGWNSLSRKCSKIFISSLSNLIESGDLIHLDISANSFETVYCTTISKSLQNNHSMYGIHAEGNYCRIDSKGFMFPSNELVPAAAFENKLQVIKVSPKVANAKSKCWICEGWNEVEFKWDNSIMLIRNGRQ